MNKYALCTLILLNISMPSMGLMPESARNYDKFHQDFNDIRQKMAQGKLKLSQEELEKITLKGINLLVKMIPDMMNPAFFNTEQGLLFAARYSIEVQAVMFSSFILPIKQAQEQKIPQEHLDQLFQEIYAHIGISEQEVKDAFEALHKIPEIEQKLHEKFQGAAVSNQ